MATELTEQGVTARAFVDEVVSCGVTHALWLVDSESGYMYEALIEAERQKRLVTVPVCREGETISIALGLLIGGKKPAIMIQNTGFFESGDSLRGHAIDFELPLVMFIGYRGFKPNRAEMNDTAAIYVEPVLQAYGIPYSIMHQDNFRTQIREAFAEADKRSGPVAILVPAEWEASR